jgi:hypothetical protein
MVPAPMMPTVSIMFVLCSCLARGGAAMFGSGGMIIRADRPGQKPKFRREVPAARAAKPATIQRRFVMDHRPGSFLGACDGLQYDARGSCTTVRSSGTWRWADRD